MSEELKLTQQDFDKIETRKDLLDTVLKKGINIEKVISTLRYEEEKKYLQIELVKLQQWANKEKKRIAIIFEGGTQQEKVEISEGLLNISTLGL